MIPARFKSEREAFSEAFNLMGSDRQQRFEEKSKIEILAIGIGHDVSRYYNKAIKIADVQELGDVMIDQLSNLFSKKTLRSLN